MTFSLHPRPGETGLDAETTNVLARNLWNIRSLLKSARKLGSSTPENLLLRHNAEELLETACAPLDDRFHRQHAKRYYENKARAEKEMRAASQKASHYTNSIKSGSFPSVPTWLHPIFSFRTSGFEGGDGSWLKIVIDNNDAQMEPPRVAVTFRCDIELEGLVNGLEELVRGLRDALPVKRDGHHA